MKCQKCGFVSFDNLNKCKKCGFTLNPSEDALFNQSMADNGRKQEMSPVNSFRPPNIDQTFESIKKDLEEIDKLSGDAADVFQDPLPGDIQSLRYAGFFIRLMAYTIDISILSCFSTVIMVAVYFLISSLSLYDPGALEIIQTFFIPYVIFSSIVEAFYFTYFHAVTGQTAGKWVCGIRVVDAEGGHLGMKKAFIRFLGYVLSWIFLYVGFLLIGLDRKKQGLHDKIAGSFVIKK